MATEKPRKTTATRTTRKRKSADEIASTPEGGGTEEAPLESSPRADMPPVDQADEEEIRRRAYELYISRGGVDGDDLSDWLEAERLVRGSRRSDRSESPTTVPPTPPTS